MHPHYEWPESRWVLLWHGVWLLPKLTTGCRAWPMVITPKTSTNNTSVVTLVSSVNKLPLSTLTFEKRVKKAVWAKKKPKKVKNWESGTCIVCFGTRGSFSQSLGKACFLVVPLPFAYTMQGEARPELLHETKEGHYILPDQQKTTTL